MSNFRFKLVDAAISRVNSAPNFSEFVKYSSIYQKNVFTLGKMKDYLPKYAYENLLSSIDQNTAIDSELAEHVSQAMKSWAMSNGVTHYTHWFQPLTGATAEKHDAFFEPGSDGVA